MNFDKATGISSLPLAGMFPVSSVYGTGKHFTAMGQGIYSGLIGYHIPENRYALGFILLAFRDTREA